MRALLTAAGFTLLVFAPATSQDAGPKLGLPIACTPGKDCFVQNYFDHDPGPGAKDHRCGSMSYDGHDGIDIRVPTTAAQKRGVAVLASAAGTVKAVRDGVEDRALGPNGRAEVAGRECGNGVVLNHPGGWETQYCHMAKGSIAVKPGQTVAAGAKLGNVGLSGWTQFPHAHLGVRRGNDTLDPFTGGAAACGSGGRSLWTSAAAAALQYASPQVINIGFASGPVSMEAVEADTVARPNRGSPALVGYVRAIGLNGGDKLLLTLTGPDGRELSRNDSQPLDRAKAQWLSFTGKKASAGPLAAGRYKLTYTVSRGGKTVLTRTAETTL